MAYGNNRFVAVGISSTLLRSNATATVWEPKTSAGVGFGGVTYGGGRFMAIGGLGVSVSTDGEIWTWHARDGVDQFGIGYGNGVYVTLTGDCMSGTLEYSLNNGQTWTKAFCATSYPIGIVYGNNRFVVVGNSSIIYTSTDGIHWEETVSGVTVPIRDLVYADGLFVAVGDLDGYPAHCYRDTTTLLTSTSQIFKFSLAVVSVDGTTWDPLYPGIPEKFLNGVAYGNGRFVAVGGEGAMTTSPDGITWTPGNPGTSLTLNGVAFGQHTFVAVGEGGNIFTSPDGIDWTQRTSGTAASLHNVAYGTGAFVAVGDDGTILVSYNGVDWSPHTSATSFDLFGIAAGKGTFNAGGNSGIFLQSDKLNYYLPLILSFFDPML